MRREKRTDRELSHSGVGQRPPEVDDAASGVDVEEGESNAAGAGACDGEGDGVLQKGQPRHPLVIAITTSSTGHSYHYVIHWSQLSLRHPLVTAITTSCGFRDTFAHVLA